MLLFFLGVKAQLSAPLGEQQKKTIKLGVSKNRGTPKWMVSLSWKTLFFNG